MESLDLFKTLTKYLGLFYALFLIGALPTIIMNIIDYEHVVKYNIYALFTVTFSNNEYFYFGGMIYQSVLILLFPVFIRLKWTNATIRDTSEKKAIPINTVVKVLRRSLGKIYQLLVIGILFVCLYYLYIQSNTRSTFSTITVNDFVLGIGLFLFTWCTELLLYPIVAFDAHSRYSKRESSLLWKKFVHRVVVLYIFTTSTAFFLRKAYCYFMNVVLIYFICDCFFRSLFGMLLPILPKYIRRRQIRLSEEYSDLIFKFFVSIVYTNLMPSICIVALVSLVWNRLYLNYRLKHEEEPIDTEGLLTKHVWSALFICSLVALFFTNFSTTFLYANSRSILYPFCFI